MPLTFNTLLADANIDPREVRLLRHETQRHGLTPYALWRDNPEAFDDYQRVQLTARRSYFASPYWASFVVAPGSRTLFVGLSAIQLGGPIPFEWIDPISGRDAGMLEAYELYDLTHSDCLAEYVGRLAIKWGVGTRSWVQRADRQDKPIVGLSETFVEPAFPGYLEFVTQLAELESLPISWRSALSAAKGIYLLTCPRTREQYVGAAYGVEGFLGRWLNYARSGHGGNVALKSRDPSDYRISILQVAGSNDDQADIEHAESL